VASLLTSFVLLEWAVGIANVLLLAPIWLQLLHLLFADLVWITLVLLTARALQDRRRDRRALRTGLSRDLMTAGAGS
jgi:heme A synthase